MDTTTRKGSEMKCKYCGKELPQKNFALAGHRPMLITLPCDCADAKAEAERESAEIERRERLKAFSEVWCRTGIPDMFQHVDADFNRVSPLMGGGALYLVGKNGRGKTHAACQVAKAFLVKNTYRDRTMMRCWKSCRFVTAQRLFSLLKTSWDRWDQNEEDVFQRFAGVDLLILDDLGKGVPSEWAAENVFRLIDVRWSNHRPTIMTSQYAMGELADRFSRAGDETMSAMMSRLDGWCESIHMDGPDRRKLDVQ